MREGYTSTGLNPVSTATFFQESIMGNSPNECSFLGDEIPWVCQNEYFKPTMQTSFNEEGNCLSACIASLFDVGINNVPFFDDNDGEWVWKLSRWMGEKFGKFLIPVGFSEPKHLFLFNNSIVIASINSPNPRVERHAVICKGRRIIFDPMKGEVDIPITDEMEATYFVIGDIRTTC